jgi:drug/metabolite transporter (DMT)-like permease
LSNFDFNKILSNSTESIKQLSVFNPFTIHKKGTKAKAIFALALVCFFWGTTWIASKEGVRHMPALQMAGIRQFLGGFCYVAYFIARGAKLPKGKEWIPVIVLSVLNFLLSNGLSTWALKYISSGLGAIMGAIFPLWLVVIGLFISRDRLPRIALLGLLLGFGGVCVIFYEHWKDFFNADFRFGIILSLIATWTWAFATIYTKKQAARFNPYFSLGLQMLISGVCLLAFTRATHSESSPSFISLTSIPWQSWTAILYLVSFGSILSFIAYLYALQHLPTEQASIYAYVNPVVAVLLGWIIFGERLTIFITVGGLVALVGVWLVNKAFKTSPSEQPETEGM